MYLSDNQRVQVAVPAALGLVIAKSIVRQSSLTDEGKARAVEILGLFKEAAVEPLMGCTHREKLERRINRLILAVTEPMVDHPCTECVWALFELLTILLEAEALVLVGGSTFDRAWELFKGWIFDASAEYGAQGKENERAFCAAEEAGRALGRMVLADLIERGVYREATVPAIAV